MYRQKTYYKIQIQSYKDMKETKLTMKTPGRPISFDINTSHEW